jgi:hypothetical protein
MTLSLWPVTSENWDEVARLEVRDDQSRFVASNSYFLAQAVYESGNTPVAIYDDDTLVGFALYTRALAGRVRHRAHDDRLALSRQRLWTPG